MADLDFSDGLSAPSWQAVARNCFVHLRLQYQILLAPIFLWGYFLAIEQIGAGTPDGGRPDGDFWIAFVAFHLCLYGGTTAFNSYYDRDEGPIGGLEKPPPVMAPLLPFSLGIQALGALLAGLVNRPFLVIYLIISGMGAAYSHPRTRWKAFPLGGLATVAIGQGVLAALGGWVTASPAMAEIGGIGWLGILAAAGITVGFYPLTQIYQVEEDLARGDRTFAAWAGTANTFRYAVSVLTLAALGLIAVVILRLGWVNGLLVGGFYSLLLIAIIRWAATYDPAQVIPNFRRIMRINMVTSGGFLLFIAGHVWGIL